MFLLSELFGLPAHALLVHAAVILVPLAALALAATGWRASWRKHYSLPVALLALAGAVFAFLAKESGEPLEDRVRKAAQAAGAARPRFGEHPEAGEAAFLWAAIFAATAVLFVVADFWGRGAWPFANGKTAPKWLGLASYAVALVPAVFALLTMVNAGHSGAELVWKDVGSFAAGK